MSSWLQISQLLRRYNIIILIFQNTNKPLLYLLFFFLQMIKKSLLFLGFVASRPRSNSRQFSEHSHPGQHHRQTEAIVRSQYPTAECLRERSGRFRFTAESTEYSEHHAWSAFHRELGWNAEGVWLNFKVSLQQNINYLFLFYRCNIYILCKQNVNRAYDRYFSKCYKK